MNAKRIAICGRNTSTEPTPAKTPSTTRLRRSPAGNCEPIAPPANAISHSMPSIRGVAHENTDWNTTAMSARKISGPHTRCSANASIRSLNVIMALTRRVTLRATTRAIQA